MQHVARRHGSLKQKSKAQLPAWNISGGDDTGMYFSTWSFGHSGMPFLKCGLGPDISPLSQFCYDVQLHFKRIMY